jgi:regulator of RNase E activity RraA
MNPTPPFLSHAEIEALRQLDTCTVSNAIETFNVRLRNTGFTDASIRSLFPDNPPLVGYAVTVRISCSGPPIEGQVAPERTDWWQSLITAPTPRIVVIEDVTPRPGNASFIGEVHAHVLKALGCVGAITNGAAHDLPGIHAAGFQMFAANLAVSHGYAHIVDFGRPVEVGGLRIQPGDLLHADRHGVLNIPLQIAARIPEVAREQQEQERRVIEFCRSGTFDLRLLRDAVRGVFPEA